MNWDEEARGILAQLCGMVPATFRELAEASAREESETLAMEREGDTVTARDVVRAWIRTTPPEQRDALVPVIEDLGFDPVDFSDDLQSEDGWDAEDEGSPGK